MGDTGFGAVSTRAPRALALVTTLGLSWCVDCSGQRAADAGGGFGGQAGALGQDETKVAVRSDGELWLVEFSDPTRPRSTMLTDQVWSVLPFLEADLSSGAAWSQSGESLAWVNDDGTAGALVDGRVVQAPLDPAETAPGVHWLDEEIVAIHPLTVLTRWQPRSGEITMRLSADVLDMAGGGYVYCQEENMHFVASSGATSAWDRTFPFFLDETGEHVALVVPEAGASGLESPLVSEIVAPEAPADALDCSNLPLTGAPLVIGPVQWSASGDRLGAVLYPWFLRVGTSPLDERSDEVKHDWTNSSLRRSWYFDGEEAHFIELGSDPERAASGQATILKRLAADGTVSTLGESDPGDWLADSVDRAPGMGAVFVADPMNSNERAVYLLDAAGQLSKLADGFTTAYDLPVLRPQPDGPGMAIFTATECQIDEPCVDPRTLVWLDPDGDPDTFFTLTGDAQWMPGADGLVVVSSGEVFFVRQDEPERLHHLAAGEEVLVPPAPEL